MNELKLVVGEEAAMSAETSMTDVSKLNPMDALNRRDIEMIKRSLVNMHKDSGELRNTIVALHARHSSAPSKGFFLVLGVVALVLVGALTVVRPRLDAALGSMPAFARITGDAMAR